MVSNKLSSLLLKNIAKPSKSKLTKISIIGTGNVGMAVAIAMLNFNDAHEICFFGRNKDRLEGETDDLYHGFHFRQNVNITTTTEIKGTQLSDVCVFTAGAKRKKGMDRLDLMKANASIIANFMPEFAKHSPNAKIIMVTNPVECMAYCAWKTSGFPFTRVIGSGTSLDSVRMASFVSARLDISPEAVESLIIGEHGNSMVHIWSGLSVGGVRLRDYDRKIGLIEETNKEKWFELNKKTVDAGKDVITLKGATWTAIGITTSCLVHSIINNMNEVYPVSTNVEGLYGIKENLYMSLPCELNRNGVCTIYTPNLDEEEKKKLQKSATALLKVQKDLDDILSKSKNDSSKK